MLVLQFGGSGWRGGLLYSRMLHIQVSFMLGSQTAYEMLLSNGVYQLARKTALDSWVGSVGAVTFCQARGSPSLPIITSLLRGKQHLTNQVTEPFLQWFKTEFESRNELEFEDLGASLGSAI